MNTTGYSTDPNAVRFRKARERVGLSPAEASHRMGILQASLWDIECCDAELMIYSPADIRRFCDVLGISPRELFGIGLGAAAINATELVALIRKNCDSRGITVEQFGDLAGWHVAHNLDEPKKFLHDYCIEAIQDICRELGIDWERFILSL